MKYVVLAYPNLTKNDYQWIQSIRKKHDIQYSAVKPHFTIVFPTEKLKESDFTKQINSRPSKSTSIDFTLTKAVVTENIYPKCYQVHLVASNQISGLIDLYNNFYNGLLSEEKRSDIIYIPHITIASNESSNLMLDLASTINKNGININGSIDNVVFASFDGKKVIDIKKLCFN